MYHMAQQTKLWTIQIIEEKRRQQRYENKQTNQFHIINRSMWIGLQLFALSSFLSLFPIAFFTVSPLPLMLCANSSYSFGVGQTGKRTGIIFNTGLNDFAVPNMPNYFGLPPSPGNYIQPKKRAMSSMSPSILAHTSSGDVQLVIGAAGGTKIPTAITSVIVYSNVLLFKCETNDENDLFLSMAPTIKNILHFRWLLVYCGLARILNKLSMHRDSITNLCQWKSITNMEIRKWVASFPSPYIFQSISVIFPHVVYFHI